MRTRSKEMIIWLTEAEYRLLEESIKRSGLSKQAFLRKAIFGYEIKELPPVDYFEILKALRQINNNMNQIAVRANSIGMVDAAAYRKNVDWLQQVVGNLMEEVYR